MKTTIYEPDNCLKKGYWRIFADIFVEFKQNRWLLFQLFKRDFLATYKQSFIGVLWAVIIPLVSVGTFVLLNRSGVFNSGNIGVPYPLYAVLGMAFWQVFATGVISGSNSLVKAGSMVVKINFSKKSLVLASSAQGVVSFLAQFLLGIILCFFYGIIPGWQIIFLPLALLPLLLLTFGVSLMLALLNGIMRDIGNSIAMLLSFLMFLAPVLYLQPTEGFLSVLMKFNPLAYLISVPRELVLSGGISNVNGFMASALVSLAVFIICIVAFHLTETRVAERI